MPPKRLVNQLPPLLFDGEVGVFPEPPPKLPKVVLIQLLKLLNIFWSQFSASHPYSLDLYLSNAPKPQSVPEF